MQRDSKRDSTSYAISARQEIANALQNLPIFSSPQSVAMYHFAAVADIETIGAILSPNPIGLSFMAHRRIVESSSHAVPQLSTRCAANGGCPSTVNQSSFEQARQLFELTYRYDAIENAFRLADKGQFLLHVAKREPRITFAYAESKADEADTLLLSRHIESMLVDRGDSNALREAVDTMAMLRDALTTRIESPTPQTCTYRVDQAIYPLMRKLGESFLASLPTHMPPEISVGDMTFASLHRFWAALLGITNTHLLAHEIAATKGTFPYNSLVFAKMKSELAELLGNVSGLPAAEVNFLVECYTYDPRVAGNIPILQPFLPIGREFVCLPFLFINHNNFERNFFKLLHRHPKLVPYVVQVEGAKEPIALEQLGELFPEPDFRNKPNVPISDKTDGDLVVYETRTGFVLVVQHKWLNEPDTDSESSSNDDKLKEGVRQSTEARDYLRANEEKLRRVLGLRDSQEITQIEAVTVCRGLEMTGFAGQQAVPVITEDSFRELHNQSSDLKAFWEQLNARPDQTKAATYARDVPQTYELCGYKFVIPSLLIRRPGSTLAA